MKELGDKIIQRLKAAYPDAKCELEFNSPFELLVATILSAQCTDKRVNAVTKTLFKSYSTPKAFAEIETAELERQIYSCGFYKTKSQSIKSCATELLTKYGGEVPNDFDSLVKLKGVGRKTANVVMANAFKGNNIAVDTHVFRVSRRLKLSNGKTPYEVEKDLMSVLDENDYSLAHHLLIFHGRYTCKSQKPNCGSCMLNDLCTSSDKRTIV